MKYLDGHDRIVTALNSDMAPPPNIPKRWPQPLGCGP